MFIKKFGDEIYECAKEQRKVWEKLETPESEQFDGFCDNCERNVYQNYEIRSNGIKYISYGCDGKTLIKSCPHCHFEFYRKEEKNKWKNMLGLLMEKICSVMN